MFFFFFRKTKRKLPAGALFYEQALPEQGYSYRTSQCRFKDGNGGLGAAVFKLPL